MSLSTYDPKSLEPQISAQWQNMGLGQPTGNGDNFCIMVPPPNITGSLHLGHGLQLTLLDTICRHQRYLGKNVLLQVGTDHAGIATQMVVERNLALKGIHKKDLTRKEFVDHIWDWVDESGGTITQQMRQIGVSVDWETERFTLDEEFTTAVSDTFIRLYEEGLIYRGKRMVNWDTVLLTAVSDLEVENEKRSGQIWYIKYPLADGTFLTVATTRPETLFGDQAVCVHPDDERYQHLIGQHVELPLCNREIPIIADDYVEPEFGTGCVKITPAHDFNDYEIGLRHQLPQLNIMHDNGTMNAACPEAYQNLDRFEARKKAVKALDELGLLDRVEPYQNSTPIGDRSLSILEPRLTNQWFVDMKKMAEHALAAQKDGRLNFIPNVWDKTYENWLVDIQDWCISRQLMWGHQVPAYYDVQGNVYVGKSEQEIREKHQISGELRQDDDVLDTWFSSALWPFATLGWPNQTQRLETFYPNQLLVTGFDIIFFLVARMVMMGMHLTNEVPFKDVFVTGLIRDDKGQKMSKSKGNVLDPIDLINGIDIEDLVAKRTKSLMQPAMKERIEKETRKAFPNGIDAHGTDALRFTLLHLCTHGRDIKFDLNRLKASRNFCNKIWNAARLLEQSQCTESSPESQLVSKALSHQLQLLLDTTSKHLSEYRFDLYATALYDFFWHQFCDWFLECSKALQCKDLQQQLNKAFDDMLIIYHPALPFITEGIWQNRHKDSPSISTLQYPLEKWSKQPQAIQDFNEIKEAISHIRRIRSELNIAPSVKFTLYVSSDENKLMANYATLVQQLAGIKSIVTTESSKTSCGFMTQSIKAAVELEGLVDIEAEQVRIHKKLLKLQKELSKIEGKIAKPHYKEKAPQTLQLKDIEDIKRCQSEIHMQQQYLDVLDTLLNC
jgi:valyl-tRNA synthetase